MTGLDTSAIPGSLVTMVKGSAHQTALILQLKNSVLDAEISMESSATIELDGKRVSLEAGPELACCLLRWLDRTVTSFQLISGIGLEICVSGESRMLVHLEGPYESFQILMGDNVVYVA